MKSSLQQVENENILANTICFLKQKQNIPYLIVEGYFDKNTFHKFCDLTSCSIQPANSKNNIISAIDELRKRKIYDCIAIRDRDYDLLITPELEDKKNIFFTDFRDLEMTIINSQAINNLLLFFEEDTTKHQLIIEKVLSTIQPIGYIRWLNDKKKFGLNFKITSLSNFIDKKTFKLDYNKYIIALVHNTNRELVKNGKKKLSFSIESLKESCTLFQKGQPIIDKKYICCGHDFIEALSLSLQYYFKKYTKIEVDINLLEKNLSLAYDMESFQTSSLYANIKTWENLNTYKILK